MLFGCGKYTYELVDGWAKLPNGLSFKSVGGITVDSQDRIYVFNRSPNAVVILDRNGNHLGSLGEGYFVAPHGIRFDHNGNLWCVDDGAHMVYKFTSEGKLLQ